MTTNATSASPPAQPANLLAYASPSPLAQLGHIFRDGPRLIARDQITLPPRCILCGDPPARRPIRLHFTWDESFTVTTRSTLQLRQKASVLAFLCPSHHARWLSGRIIGIAGIAIAIALMAAGLATSILSESSDVPRYTPLGIAFILSGFAVLILSLFFFTFRTRTLTCSRIEAGYLYLEGAAPSFIQPLPLFPGTPVTPSP